MKQLLLLIFISLFAVVGYGQNFTISGTVTDTETGETLIGANVGDFASQRVASTNVYGFYSLTLPAGVYTISYSYIGVETIKKEVDLTKGDVQLNLELNTSSVKIGEAVVEDENQLEENVGSTEMSTVAMSMKEIKKIPAFMGEVDLIKAIQLLPGVTTVGEGSSGFYVRGGAVDQNLILLDEASVYNASHLLGFFSVFNSDAIKDVKLYKGGIPARYGGRLSSVLDIRMKEGNRKKFAMSGGIGTVSSRLTLEAPIAKGKGSLLISGRRTYADLFLLLSKDPEIRKTKLFFYDLNLKGNYQLSEKDRLFLSGYLGRDVSAFGDEFKIAWGNVTSTARWNHIFNSKLFSNVTLVYSDFNYLLADSDPQFGIEWSSHITDKSVKADFGYYINPNNTLRFGAIATHHNLDPGSLRGTGANSEINDLKLPVNNSRELAFYLSNEQKVTEKFKVQYGLRHSVFQNVGESTYWNYDDNFESIDSVYQAKGNVYNTYNGWEPRLGVNYRINKKSSVKASYNRTFQYLHLASNGTASSPLDIWFSSSPNVKPQRSDQVAIGYFRNFEKYKLEGSVEFYYKDMINAIDFKNHAQLLLNKKLEGELRFGDARSYGMELMVRKRQGKLTGMVSYTLARSEKNISDISPDWYPVKYDKTHDISVQVAYEINDRMTLGTNFVYSTGQAVTLPTGRFEYFGVVVPVYSDRNSGRFPTFHRLDLSFTWQSKKNDKRRIQVERVFSLYNAYFRKNTYSINFRPSEDDPNVLEAYKTYLLPIVPSMTWNFKF